MRYQVPQFIEMEDKIIGPFTLKQFLYLISVPVFCYILHFFAQLPYVVLVGVILFPITILLAFFRINGHPFTQVLAGLLRFIARPQMYVWKRIAEPAKEQNISTKPSHQTSPKKESKEDLEKLAQLLDRGN